MFGKADKEIIVINNERAPACNATIYKMEVGKESLDDHSVENPLKLIFSLFSKIVTKSWAHHQFLVFHYKTEQGKFGEFSVDYNQTCVKVTYGDWRKGRKDFKMFQIVNVLGAKVKDVFE